MERSAAKSANGWQMRDVVQAVPQIPVNTHIAVLITGICKGSRLRNSANCHPSKIGGDRHASLCDWRSP